MAAPLPASDQPTEPIAVPVNMRHSSQTYAFQVIPPRSNEWEREAVALEAVMQSLVLEKRRPVALEIAGAATQKQFLVRTESEVADIHAKAHIRARYSQAEIRSLTRANDPFLLGPHERVSVIELKSGAPSYLPMRSLDEQAIQQPGADPILGVLASLSLPPDERAVCQIALVPAPLSWSKAHLRKAVEHPLEPERIRRQERLQAGRVGGPSTTGVVVLVVIFALVVLYSHFKAVLPAWVFLAAGDIFLHGTWPALTPDQQSVLLVGGIGLFVALAGIFIGIDQVKRRLVSQPLYEQRLVAAKTGKTAYRIRLRLYVIGPGPQESLVRLRWRLVRYEFAVAWWHLRRIVTQGVFPLRWVGRLLSSNARYFLRCAQFARSFPSWKRSWFYWKRYWSRHLPTVKTKIPPKPLPPAGGWQHVQALEEEEQKQRRRRAETLLSLVAAYRQFDTASAGHFRPKPLPAWRATLLIRPKKSWWLKRWSGWACDVARSNHFVTGDFLGMAWRLPQSVDLAELPLIEQKRSRTLLIPSCLIAEPSVPPAGFSEHGGYVFPFAFPASFFTAHTLIGGKSGEGKSTLMEHMARAAMMRGALCVLDPHGDFARDVLRLVPPHRLADVVYLDLGDKDYSVGFNPLDVTLGQDRDLMVASVVSTLSHIWESGWGTRMEAPFRAALMTLYEANEALCQRDRLKGPQQQYTLLDILQVLTDESFCHDLLDDVQDTFVHRFWYSYYDPLDLRQQRERIDPILTKIAQFETKIARHILGQSQSTINLSKIITENKILVVRLASGEAGTQTSPLVGATLLGLLMTAMREQSVLAEASRVHMAIMIDEFQSIPGADYSVLMAELRKYGASAVLATQSFEYLNKVNVHLLPTVLANIKQHFVFRMSAEDARLIAKELDVTEADIINTDVHTCYVKMLSQGRQQPTFSMRLQLPILESMEQAIAIRDHCRQVYTRRAADIEQQLLEAVGRAISASQHRKAKEEEVAKRGSADGYAEDDEDTEKRKAVKKTGPSIESSGTPRASGNQTTVQGGTPTSPQTVNAASPSEMPGPKETGAGGDGKPRPHVQFPSKKKREQDLVSSFDMHPLDEGEKETEL